MVGVNLSLEINFRFHGNLMLNDFPENNVKLQELFQLKFTAQEGVQ